MLGWGRVGSSDYNFNLRKNSAGNFGVIAYEMESSSSLTVETHNFSERLSNHHLETLIEEVSETFSIFVEVSSHKALVGSIEEGVKLVLLADSSNFFPLIQSWVNSGWVVSTSMEKNT